MHDRIAIDTIEMHTAGEPVRLVVGGFPAPEGATILDKRRDAAARLDHLRRFLMHEPRGHYDMYGALPVAPDLPGADLAVLFLHNAGWSTMCGHAVIALGRWAIDSGRVQARGNPAPVAIQCPCGLVRARVALDSDGKAGAVSFESVPAFAFALDRELDVPGFGRVTVDVGYGGAFYAVLPAQRLGLALPGARLAALVDAADAVTRACQAAIALDHPDSADLAFFYGTILTDGGDGAAQPSVNVCVFADREVDRSPTGSGVTARLALAAARNAAAARAPHIFRSPTGEDFAGRVVGETRAGRFAAVTVEVSGRAYYTGTARFTVEPGDPLAGGFLLR
jgi:proline racemase